MTVTAEHEIKSRGLLEHLFMWDHLGHKPMKPAPILEQVQDETVTGNHVRNWHFCFQARVETKNKVQSKKDEWR